VAYIGYNAGLSAAPNPTLPRRARAKLAWGRLAVVAASLLAWAGIIAAARAIF